MSIRTTGRLRFSPPAIRCTSRRAGSLISCCRSSRNGKVSKKHHKEDQYMNRRTALIGLALAGLGFASLPAMAADYPSRNVTIIVPYPAGGPTDELARIVADSLSKQMNQSFVVENVTGGGTIIGTNKVVKSSPDGYTLLLHNLQISANPTLYKSLPFDTDKDLTPVIFINRNPLVLIA